MIKECLKENTGVCTGCEAFERCKRLIALGVKYQDALAYTRDTSCHPGYEPSTKSSFDADGITSLTLESDEIPI